MGRGTIAQARPGLTFRSGAIGTASDPAPPKEAQERWWTAGGSNP